MTNHEQNSPVKRAPHWQTPLRYPVTKVWHDWVAVYPERAEVLSYRVLRALIPWDRIGIRRFPGFGRTLEAVIGVGAQQVGHWRAGRSSPSLRVLERMHAAVVERRDTFAGLALELEAEIAAARVRQAARLPIWLRKRRKHMPGDAA